MRKFFIICFLLVGLSFNIAQSIAVKINSNIYNKVILLSLEDEKVSFIDSINTINNCAIQFSVENHSNGFYRLSFAPNIHLDFIFDNEEIDIETDFNNLLDSLKVIKSESNKIYYEFLKLNKKYKTKTELLNLILARFPQEDDYYTTTQTKLNEIQKEYLEFVNETSQNEPSSFIARYIRSSQIPILPLNIPTKQQLSYLKSHSLDNINFNDAELISSDMFTNKSIEYLTYYRNPQLPKELLEQEFMKAVDSLLNKAKVNQLVYQHITEYLIDGFKKFGFDKIIDYIVENYVIEDDLCLDEETENSIQKRINQAKLLAVGTKAPNIIMPDRDGKVIDLLDIQSDKTLLVFYASWCPHCKELLPQLNDFKKDNEIEILAISLDSKKEDWLKFVEDNNINSINLNDPNGWDGKAASDYYLYATPTMFLLDSEKKIIGKPTSYEELLSIL